MIRRGTLATRLGAVGLAVFVAGAALIGTAVMAGATGSTGCASSCSITATSTTGLDPASAVQVNGTGFAPKATGAVVECNLAPGEPTVSVPDDPPSFTNLGSLPVGCSSPNQTPAKVSKTGTIFGGPGVTVGTIGPPAVGADSSGGQAATDAVNYPCPPSQAQVTAGVSCAFVYQDSKGEMASVDISFTTPYSTIPTTTTTAAPAATTTQPCNGVAHTASVLNTKGTGTTATVTVTPATCLVGGMATTVTASGLVANSVGSILECSADPAQPGVTYLGTFIPISCSKIAIVSTTASGSLPSTSQSFTVLESTASNVIGGQNSGPESNTGTSTSCTGTCTGNLTADASAYPCPPTPAQVAAGVTCVIAVGDLGGDQVPVPISFNTAVAPPANGGGGATGAASASAAKASATKASSGALAFTGAGPGLMIMGLVGILLVVLGGSTVLLVDGPRRLWMTWAKAGRSAPSGDAEN